MAEASRKLEDIEWLGGHPALDFVNTVHSRVDDYCEDYLTSYGDLLDWHQAANLVCDSDAQTLAATNPRAQAKAFKEARELREGLYRIFHAAVEGRHLPEDDLEQLSHVVAASARWRMLLPVKETCSIGWDFEDARADTLLGPVAWEAIGLLTGEKMKRLKECPAPDGCGWLFLDLSKNRSRQWCSMKTCGNNAKVKRFRKKRA